MRVLAAFLTKATFSTAVSRVVRGLSLLRLPLIFASFYHSDKWVRATANQHLLELDRKLCAYQLFRLLKVTVYIFNYDRSLTRVTALTPERGTVNGKAYAMVVPADCLRVAI